MSDLDRIRQWRDRLRANPRPINLKPITVWEWVPSDAIRILAKLRRRTAEPVAE